MRFALSGVGAVRPQQVPVVLDHHAAAAGGDDHRLGIAVEVRPPGVDVALGERDGLADLVEVVRQRAAAAAAAAHQRNADAIEDARHRGVDARGQRRLHAAVEDEHLARVARRRPDARRRRIGNPRAQLLGQQRFHRAADGQRTAEQRLRHQSAPQRPSHRLLRGRASDALVDDVTPDVEQPTVLNARRARRLAIAAGEAAVEVQLRLGGDRTSLQHLLDEIDAPARSVELVAEQLVRRARRVAEAAVHAGAKDRVGLAAFRCVLDEIGERGLHGGVRSPRKAVRG